MLQIVAYTNVLSAEPGECLEVKVGSYGAQSYKADLRRIIQGDRNPSGPGYRDEHVDLDLGGQRTARVQSIKPGSYVEISDRGHVLMEMRSFTLAIPIWPTLIGTTERTIFYLTGRNLRLFVNVDGQASAEFGDQLVALNGTLELKKWALLILSFDAVTSALRLSQLNPDGKCLESVKATAQIEMFMEYPTRVLFAARAPGMEHFDGKIDGPVLFDCAMSAEEAAVRIAMPHNLSRQPELVAHWDFSRGMEGRAITDLSPHQLHGVTYQCPARAMTGWRWRGQCLDWRQNSELYSAIHFHSDDLADANWETDFSFELPKDLASGIYSVRLVPDGNEDYAYHCVFAVRPSHTVTSGNKVCFIMPVASYLAYANHRLGLDVPGTEVGMGRLVEIDKHHAFLQKHPELGLSFYEVHADGSGVFYSSRNRPIVDMQPGVKGFLGGLGSNVWQFNADTHITGWLEHQGVRYDVITDEDLHNEGLSLLRRYKVAITGTHPEYYSLEMLDAVQGFVDRGGRLMYLGGNGFYWRISFSDSHPGIIECRRSEAGIRPWEPGIGQFYHAFTGEYGGLWRRNGRSSAELTGLVMSSQGFDVSEPYALSIAAADPRLNFMFEGIDRTAGREFGAFGLSGGGAAGLEIDRADFALGTPSHALVLGSSKCHTDIYLMTPEDLLDPTPDMSGTQNDLIRSDLVYLETANGGSVFSTGSIAWAGAVAWNNYDNEVSRLTWNVLRHFVST